MTVWRYLIMFAVPLAALGIALAKSVRWWLPLMQGMEQWQRVLVIVAFGMVVAFGGAKGPPPGPSKANLRLLLAERVRLSNGMEYGEKSEALVAGRDVELAQGAAESASSDVVAASNLVAAAAGNVLAAGDERRMYMRLHTPPPEMPLHGTLYGEIACLSVHKGVAEAAVWFNVVPASAPGMRFTFAMRSATNRWLTIASEQSSWPDTFMALGRQCYLFFFAAPPELLDDGGALLAPLLYTQQIGWGCPETNEPFDMRGGMAFEVDGGLWEAVNGTRTNEAGEVFYFEGGRLAEPPALQGEEAALDVL